MSITRAIKGLKYAVTSSKPPHIGVTRARGAKAHGVRYERQVAKALPLARHGQWFQFIDENGHGWCQTDLLLEFLQAVFIVESKYTWTPQGHFQVERLYQPVVARAFGKPAFGLVICRALRDESEMTGVMVCNRLMDGLAWCQHKQVALHWLGEAPFLRVDPGTHLGPAISPHTPVLVPRARSA